MSQAQRTGGANDQPAVAPPDSMRSAQHGEQAAPTVSPATQDAGRQDPNREHQDDGERNQGYLGTPFVPRADRLRFAVEVEASDDKVARQYAVDDWILEQDNPDFQEMSQKHMGCFDIDSRVVTQEQYLELFDEDNDYMAHVELDRKLSYINRVKK